MKPAGAVPAEGRPSRRQFLKQSTLAALAVAGGTFTADAATGRPGGSRAATPWYRRVTRWGQTNITEIDPTRYDIGWWRQHWRRTLTQGVVINAGGIVAYYPSRIPRHRPARYLEGRDLFGDLCRAAHDDGLVVFARMDSNRAHEELYRAHPDWFALDAAGEAYRAGELYLTCVNGWYYEEQIPSILREIIERYRPEGFTDNSWSGLGRATICHCANCRERFRQRTGADLPARRDWDDPVYREWIRWNYDRRLELWDLNNGVTRSAGGADCIWVGMNSGSISGQAQSFRDYRAICARAEMVMLDHQSRSDAAGFQENAAVGKLIHGLLGWDKLIPESMAMYQAGRPTFRMASKPPAEARLWMVEGFAGGIQPWWHHVGAYHEDRRMYRTAEPLYRWHRAQEEFLLHRRPLATVGLVWSQENTDFYGRDEAEIMVDQPWRGWIQALVRARIPYLPVHADDIDRDGGQLKALVLPELGVISETQVSAVRRFVANGGGLVATGRTSRFDAAGRARPDFALADLFGAHAEAGPPASESTHRRWAGDTAHTYLRLRPERRALAGGGEEAIGAGRCRLGPL